LFLVGESAVTATLYVLVWESHGVPLFLGAAYISAGYQRTLRPGLAAISVAALSVLAIWAKEPFLACLPFLVLVATCHVGGGEYRLPAMSSRNALLLAWLGGAVTVGCLLPILVTKAQVLPGGHAQSYSSAFITARHAIDDAKVMLALSTRAPHYPTNVLLYGMVVLAGILAARAGRARTALVAGVIALSLPLAGWLIYLPWRYTPSYYGLPFLLGPALLVALAITACVRWASARLRPWPVLVGLLAIGYAGLVAYNTTGAFFAQAHVEGEVARSLAGTRANEPYVVGVSDPAVSGRFGDELAQYAQTLGAGSGLTIRDVSCGDAAARDHLVILFSHSCAAADTAQGLPHVRTERLYTSIDWRSFRVSDVRLNGYVWGPSPGASSNSH
jgi:hypothetical protein